MSASRSTPRPNRAGETFARTHRQQDGEGPATKKPRFDVRNPSALAADAPDEEEDAILQLDEVGKGGQSAKRNAVNLDGFESDSSNENFDTRADAKAKKAQKDGADRRKPEQEEENDMFADLEEDFNDGDEDEDLAREGKKRKKDVRFLDTADIQGQDLSSTAGGHVSADFNWSGKEEDKASAPSKAQEESSDSDDADRPPAGSEEVDDEIGAGGRKAHAPKLDAFNMKGEMEEGKFDDSGNFVRKAADPDAVHDTWLDGVSKKDMRRAKEAAERREAERRKKDLAEDELLTGDILRTLITNLDRGETALEALARLGKGAPKKQPKWKNKNKNRRKADAEKAADSEMSEENPVETERREAVESITEAANSLMSRGQIDVYSEERELLQRQYRRETGEDWAEPPDSVVAQARHDDS